MSTPKRAFSSGLVLFSTLNILLSALPGLAAEGGFDYPELLVTPRASERLQMEAKRERENRWMTHIPVQVSALTTLAAGFIQTGYKDKHEDPSGQSPWAGIAIGGGWLVTTAILASTYHPYQAALDDLKDTSGKTQREQLTRERMAEESINKAAATGRKLMWLSTVTNLGASTFMLVKSEKDSISMVADLVAMAASFSPVLFQYRWQSVAAEQQNYKKRIYAPVASAAVLPEPTTGKPTLGLTLSMAF